MNKTLNELAAEAHKIACEKGWWNNWKDDVTPEEHASRVIVLLALITSEVSEAVEDARRGKFDRHTEDDGKPTGLPSELADIVIRCMDVAEGLGIDLQWEVEDKMRYNKTRTLKHGGKLV